MTWIAAIAAIPFCAFLYRMRGAGWRYAPPESKTVGLFLLSMVMASPIAAPGFLTDGFLATAAVLIWFVPILSGRAGHGEYYHDGDPDHVPPRNRNDNDWIGWIWDWPDYEVSTWADRAGLGLTGLIMTGPTAIAALIAGQWAYAILIALAGLIGKPGAYAIGWRLTGGATEHGEWGYGAFIGLAVFLGHALQQTGWGQW